MRAPRLLPPQRAATSMLAPSKFFAPLAALLSLAFLSG